jgi:hypothetical protein
MGMVLPVVQSQRYPKPLQTLSCHTDKTSNFTPTTLKNDLVYPDPHLSLTYPTPLPAAALAFHPRSDDGLGALMALRKETSLEISW